MLQDQATEPYMAGEVVAATLLAVHVGSVPFSNSKCLLILPDTWGAPLQRTSACRLQWRPCTAERLVQHLRILTALAPKAHACSSVHILA